MTFPEDLSLSLKYCNGWAKVQAGQLSSSEPCQGPNAQHPCSPGSSPTWAPLAGQIHLLLPTLCQGRTLLPKDQWQRGGGTPGHEHHLWTILAVFPSLCQNSTWLCPRAPSPSTSLQVFSSANFNLANAGDSQTNVALPNHSPSLPF